MYFTTFARRKISMLMKKLGLFSHSKNSYNRIDSTESSKTCKVLKGHIGMYVGEERKRYEVPVKYLSLPAFQELFVQSQEDELEAKIEGPIMLACKTEEFDQLLKLAKISKNKRHQDRTAALDVWEKLQDFVCSRSHS
ncbi:auxin-responsive protein SAUR20-like [Quercus suber]|uniref:auxin-responsive protein SAUR20-like n=1 Tax=Quercus suber TaxID=58331 RepID=UPI0032DE5C6E